jgi:hypothetical protein
MTRPTAGPPLERCRRGSWTRSDVDATQPSACGQVVLAHKSLISLGSTNSFVWTGKLWGSWLLMDVDDPSKDDHGHSTVRFSGKRRWEHLSQEASEC